MARGHVLALVALLTVATSEYLRTADLGFSRLRFEDISESDVVSPLMLCLIRLSFSSVVFVSLYYVVSDKEGLEVTVSSSDGALQTITLKHLERLSTFTMWCWTLQGFYFLFAAISTAVSHLGGGRALSSLQAFKITCWISFEISFALAYLVTFLVSFVLIPAAISRKIPHKFFAPVPVLCHNANSIFMGVEIALNRLSMPLSHIAFIQLFGLAYVVFAWNLHRKKGIFFYFFLDYDRPYAVFWYLGLFIAVNLTLSQSSPISHEFVFL